MALFDEQRGRTRLIPSDLDQWREEAAGKKRSAGRRTKSLIPAMRSTATLLGDGNTSDLAHPVARVSWKRRYTASSVAIDLAAAMAASVFAVVVRFGSTAPDIYLLGSAFLPLLWIALVAMHRAYEHRFTGVGTEEFGRVMRAGVTLMAIVAFASYITKAEYARGYVVIAIPALVVLALIGRCAQRAWLHQQRAQGRCVQRTLLVGSASDVTWTAGRLRGDSSHGMSVVGACVSSDVAESDIRVPVYGDLLDIHTAVVTTGAELVTVLSSAQLSGLDLRRLAWQLEPTGAELVVCSGLIEIAGARITIRPTANSPMLQVTRARLSGPAKLVKGIFDRGSALLGLIVLAPILVTIGAWIWSKDWGSPLFRQQRVGRNGREFTLYKFRTMVSEAENLKVELLEHNESDGVLFKIAQDPRVTPVGRRLRRYSLDELPQLLNVVRGEMSLVGPRPPLPQEVSAYGLDMRRRLLVKPGLTGLWQVSGRSDLSWAEAERLDIRYVENWTLGYDLVILWRTLRAVIGGSGAY